MTNILETAKLAIAQGLCVVPPREDGTKAPDATSWKTYQTRLPTKDELNAWYRDGKRHGIGLVCGAISGGLELFEFESTAIKLGLLTRFCEAMLDLGEDELLNRLINGYSERSASGGLHFLYRCLVTRTEKLASTPDHRTLIETKGEGGYVIIAPSHGPVSPAGGAWELHEGNLSTIPTITPEERALIHRVARTLDQAPINDPRFVRPNTYDTTTPSPLDLYRDDPSITETTVQLLEKHGWTRTGQTGDTIYLCRPGKTRGISATVGHLAPGVTTIFTTSTPLDARTYSPGDLYAHMECAGDISAATRALRDLGYAPPIDPHTPVIAHDPPPTRQPTDIQNDDSPEATGWEPIELGPVWRGETPDQPPTILTRADDIALVYPGKVSVVFGESESMKTWLALCAIAEQLKLGHPCLYIDFEDSPPTIIERLRLLGIQPDAPITYIRPDMAFSYLAQDQLDQLLHAIRPVLVVLDGVTEAMTNEGLDLMSNGDIARWMKALPRWIARHPASPAVVMIDHVPKNPDGRGKGAIGGQHKRAGIDGVGLCCTVGSEPLARGRDGRARITIDKDRPGHVRAHAAAKGHIGDLVITHFANQLKWHIETPNDEPIDTRQNLADTVLDILTELDRPTSIRGLSIELRNRNHSHANEAITNTLEMLAAEDKVESGKGPNGYPVWSLKPVDNLL